jgi:DNA-binding NtrC family response regulator
MARVCVIDDKEILRESLTVTLVREDHAVTAYANPVEALPALKAQQFDVVLTDLKMPRMDGVALLRHLRESGCDTPVIMMTAYATVDTAVEALKLGAFDYIQKPFEADAIVVLVERALEHVRLRSENEALRASLDDLRPPRELVGGGPAMQRLRRQLDRVAASHDTVLISGESGTGKELVASYIHHASPRGAKPLMCLNCAALSPNLLESELFGHERGAFTGAERTRKGRFELADGGTLLLDEISEMAVPLQSKLLRVLQEGQFERVGSSNTRAADVRVLATTNRDLEAWVAKGRFREDLFYRLNVLPVRLPPLRERVEDLTELVAHFLAQVVARNGLQPVQVAPSAIKVLQSYSWPGNVRELENLCRRAAILCPSGSITAELIEPWLRPPTPREEDVFSTLREGRMLEDIERRLIERTLERFNGHRAKSAKALGMGVRTLGMKLKQWREEAAREAEREVEHAGHLQRSA